MSCFYCRTLMTAQVGCNEVRVSSREGKLAVLSREESELRDYIKHLVRAPARSHKTSRISTQFSLLCAAFQIAVHQATLFREIGLWLGWSLLSFNRNVGLGALEPIGSAQTLTLLSPRKDRCCLCDVASFVTFFT